MGGGEGGGGEGGGGEGGGEGAIRAARRAVCDGRVHCSRTAIPRGTALQADSLRCRDRSVPAACAPAHPHAVLGGAPSSPTTHNLISLVSLAPSCLAGFRVRARASCRQSTPLPARLTRFSLPSHGWMVSWSLVDDDRHIQIRWPVLGM